MCRTDNSIKNHWNSSLKKKLDFYLASVASSILNTYGLMQELPDSNCFMPILNVKDLAEHSPESILKNAAESFPSTPSIIRRRKRTCTPLSFDTNERLYGLSIHDNLHTTEENGRTDSYLGQVLSPNSSLYLIPCNDNQETELSYEGGFNFSPPYRLRPMRTAIFKSIEKQLDFTPKPEIDDMKCASPTGTIVPPLCCFPSPSTTDLISYMHCILHNYKISV